MKLSTFVAEHRRAILAALELGHPPSVGTYSEELLREAKAKGRPQMGSVRYEQHAVHLEFIYPDPLGASAVVTVTIDAPERIVFLPVPPWVIESIWQGDIDGSYVFESEAQIAMAALGNELEPDRNEKWFGARVAKRRE